MGAMENLMPLQASRIASRVAVRLDTAAVNTLWITMTQNAAHECQSFSYPLLQALRELLATVKEADGNWLCDGQLKPVHYGVLRSAHPDYFSLGGDLAHFQSCIKRRDSRGLFDYSRLCLDIIYEWATSFNSRMTTIALVQGRALGGGFETVLAADFIIAEEQSEFGFPEIMFGLFPCTGGMSLLARRVGVHQAERMMTNGRIYTATELEQMGVIDRVCPAGQGANAVEKFIAHHAKQRLARQMLQRSRHRHAPLDYNELVTVVREWVELAMALPESDLRVMDMLIRLQRPTGGRANAVAAAAGG